MLGMKESEIPKFLAEELSKEPYNLNLNLISFTSLQGDALMKIFQTILVEIQPKLKDVYAEGTETDKVQETMELLRILKFWPKCFDQHTLKTAIESVNQEVIWDTMGWLLTRKDELKKRAYLSLYLVKPTIPDEYLYDNDVQQVYEEYETKIEEFKNIHKKLEETKKNKGVSDLVNDLKAIEREFDSCSRKLDIMKTKCNLEKYPDKDEYLQLAEDLRHARNEKNKMSSQLYLEERRLWCLEKKAGYLLNKVQEISDLNAHSSPEGLLERIEQDCEILKFIVHHKIPQDIAEVQRKIRALQLVISASPECPSDLDSIRQKIMLIQSDIQSLEMESKSKDTDASLTFARQKAHQNKKKKVELLEELEELRRDMLDQQNILREKRETRKQLFPDGIPCLNSRDYKEYVKTMKVKAAKYKSMRADIAAVQAEVGILSTTKYLVQEELKESVEELKKLEEKFGLVGFSCVQERVEQEQNIHEQNDESKMRYIYEISEKARELQERVKAKKADVEPLARGVIEAKQEIKTLELHSKRLNNAFEADMGPILESIRRFETRISKIQEEIIKMQEETSQKLAQIVVMKTNLQRAQAEEKLLENNPKSTHSFKNRILTRVVDQERLQKVLNQDMAKLEQSQAYDVKQNELWGNLKTFLEVKKQLLKGRPETSDE